ncbi:MAG: PaaI family thioesterase [Acidimicrobiales bacterium]
MSTTLTPEAINVAVAEAFPGSASSCVELGDGWVTARITPDASSLRPGGFISGPTQFSLADAALWFMVFNAIGRIELMSLTSELSIRYLRPAIGETLWAKATLDSAGRRNVIGTVRLWVDDRDDKPTSVAQGTYILPNN